MNPPLRKALFLDRDGVINLDHAYVHRIDQFDFCPGIAELIAHAVACNYAVVVVTNQAGIGRGLYTEADFQKLNTWMLAELAQRGALIDRVYHCPYHPDHGVGEYRRDSPLRKPNPGMLLLAAQELGLDLSRSLIVGDHESDIQAGIRAGLAQTVLIDWSGSARPQTQASAVVHSLQAVAALLDAPSTSHKS